MWRHCQLLQSLCLAAITMMMGLHWAAATAAAAADGSPAQPLRSHTAAHIEPLLSFRVVHEDNAHLHQTGMNTMGVRSTFERGVNSANSVGAHSVRMRQFGAHRQPFPATIRVTFEAFGQQFDIDNLQLDTRLWGSKAHVEVHGGEGETPLRHPLMLNTYRTEMPDNQGWAVVTLAEDGLMTATIMKGGESYQIDPLFLHLSDVADGAAQQSLRTLAVHNMVAVRHADLPHLHDNTAQCEAVVPEDKDESAHARVRTAPADGTDAAPSSHSMGSFSSLDARGQAQKTHGGNATAVPRRHLLASAPGSGITRWTGCYTNDHLAHRLSHGVVVDYGFYQKHGSSLPNVLNAIANNYASVNAVFTAQFNVYLEIVQVIVKTAADGNSWNNAPAAPGSRCTGLEARDTLHAFRPWKVSNYYRTIGLWHLLTACFPAPGIIGIAFVASLCDDWSVGLTSWTPAMWITLAHELGHNMGASHTFQQGEGTTGGLMDYGDGLLNGIYQFNTQYSKSEICAEIEFTRRYTDVTPYCWSLHSSTCGNGLVELGEDCDDSSACCSNCLWTAGSQCSPGNAASANPCCTSACKYVPSTTTCMNGIGICTNGVCTNVVCERYSGGWTFCGMTSGGCKQQCQSQSLGRACQVATNIEPGVMCSSSPYSTCSSSGTCVATTAPITYSWKIGVAGSCSCAASATRTVTCLASSGATVADSACSGAKPVTVVSCTAPLSCYNWLSSSWSACSVDCGGGAQSCTAICVNSIAPSVAVSTSFCSHISAPPAWQACSTAACPIAWVAGDFGPCSASSCGGGTRSRSVGCGQTQNGAITLVNAQRCTGVAPHSSEACNTSPCPCAAHAVPVHGGRGSCATSIASGSSCSFQCDPGYTLTGEQYRCDNGALSGGQSCSPNSCSWPFLSLPANAAYGSCGSVLDHGGSCSIECDYSYELHGEPYECIAGTANATEQICIQRTCPGPTVMKQPPHSRGCSALMAEAETCDLECDAGYTLTGAQYRCDNGVLSGDQSCEPSRCIFPETLRLRPNTNRGTCGYRLGHNETCSLICHWNYEVRGDPYYHCAYGVLSGSQSCEPQRCPGGASWYGQPPRSSGCTEPMERDSVCYVTCDAGYSVTGNVYYCSDMGSLYHSGVPQTCVPSSCAAPLSQNPAHGDVGSCGSNLGHDASCSIRCHDGYTRVGGGYSCAYGITSGGPQSCTPSNCAAPISLKPTPHGALGSCGVALTSGAMCSFNCTGGYEIAGAPYTCVAGTVTGGPQRCIPVMAPGAADQVPPMGERDSVTTDGSASSVVPGMADGVALNVLIGVGTAIVLLAIVLAVILYRKRRSMQAVHFRPDKGGPDGRPPPGVQLSPLVPAHWFADEDDHGAATAGRLPERAQLPPAVLSVPDFASPIGSIHLQFDADDHPPQGELGCAADTESAHPHSSWVYVNPDADEVAAAERKEEPVSMPPTPPASSVAAVPLPASAEPCLVIDPGVTDSARSVSVTVTATHPPAPLPRPSPLSASSSSVSAGGAILPPPRAIRTLAQRINRNALQHQ